MEDFVEIENTYNKEGYLVKKTANGIPIFIPKELTPRVQIMDLDTEWIIEKKFMSKEQYNQMYK